MTPVPDEIVIRLRRNWGSLEKQEEVMTDAKIQQHEWIDTG